MTDTSHIVEVPSPGISGDLPRLLQAREILEALPAAVYTTNAEGQITFYNEAAAALWGCRPELGSSYFCGSWRLYWSDGQPMRHDECPMAVTLRENRAIRGAEAIAERPDGTMVPFIPYPTPLRDASGRLVGAVNMLVDITERKRAEQRQKALVDELNHRVKNMLSTVQSLAMQTFSRSGIPLHARRAFEHRLFALSTAHDQLSLGGWESSDFSVILNNLLAPFGAGERILLEGEPVSLESQDGADARDGPARARHQRRQIWSAFDARRSRRSELGIGRRRGRAAASSSPGHETGGPAVEKPARRGFGTQLVERAVEKELHGAADLAFAATGVRCRLEVPIDR